MTPIDSFDSLRLFVSTTLVSVLFRIAAAIVFWFVGRWLIARIVRLTQIAMARGAIDATLGKYLASILGIALNVALVLGILGHFGVQTTSFAALIAGAGVAIGAAWSGLLGNFAAGAFLLVLRPIKVGDLVSVAGVTGTVRELGLFGTTLVTPDNVLTLIGNGKVFGETIQNFSALPVRRVDRTAQLGKEVDPFDAVVRLRAAVEAIPNVASTPAPEIALLEMKADGPLIAVRPYTHARNYRQVFHDTNEAIVRVGREAGWPVPTTA